MSLGQQGGGILAPVCCTIWLIQSICGFTWIASTIRCSKQAPRYSHPALPTAATRTRASVLLLPRQVLSLLRPSVNAQPASGVGAARSDLLLLVSRSGRIPAPHVLHHMVHMRQDMATLLSQSLPYTHTHMCCCCYHCCLSWGEGGGGSEECAASSGVGAAGWPRFCTPNPAPSA